ncbi:unnamed protein product [Heligmosomoides polygyrus]|uniref:Uncharacterized protein n=1 Tax=Heligmosomoides polygyrus TaxID=6339 RepID=A0A183FMP9_HELPZ|nr:unnamed protein product [Heligmosomoides polygyrus]
MMHRIPAQHRGNRGDRKGVKRMKDSNGEPHEDVRAPTSFEAEAPVPVAVPGSPHLGQQLQCTVRHPPMSPRNHPGFVYPVFASKSNIVMADFSSSDESDLPASGADVVEGTPHSEGAAPPQVSELPGVNAVQQERDITGWVEEVRGNLFEIFDRFLFLYGTHRPGGFQPLLENIALPPRILELLLNGADQENVVEEFRRNMMEMYARFLLLFYANISSRN